MMPSMEQKCSTNQRNKNSLKDNHLIKTTAAHLTFGEYHNVFLTEKEYKQLNVDFSELDSLIEQLSAYIQSTGKKYADHAATLRIWAKRQKALIKQQKHSDLVRRLKAEGFSDPAMLDWTFENDNGRSPQMHHAHRYVEQWQTMRAENLGLLLWGGVGTGKSFLAGCIANALMEQEVPVRMTNFARILNELNSSFSGRNDVVDKLCRYPLLIIDDFGMERGTDYALEQIYNIVDSRYRSRKPLIITTNLTLDEIRHPQDTAHARIYDRLLEMCVPISCIGMSFRQETAQEKLERMKLLIG